MVGFATNPENPGEGIISFKLVNMTPGGACHQGVKRGWR